MAIQDKVAPAVETTCEITVDTDFIYGMLTAVSREAKDGRINTGQFMLRLGEFLLPDEAPVRSKQYFEMVFAKFCDLFPKGALCNFVEAVIKSAIYFLEKVRNTPAYKADGETLIEKPNYLLNADFYKFTELSLALEDDIKLLESISEH